MPKYSFIIPVYNRPDEVDELLGSLSKQTVSDFEVVVVEDGSDKDCEAVVANFADSLDLYYHRIPNSGPGQARNQGANKARGVWFVFLDSDTLLPPDYLRHVDQYVSSTNVDAYGGADRDKKDFLPIQRAISYSMTSMLTTGGIRGRNKSMERFKPRSFNMGIKRSVFEQLGGFGSMRYGEDIDFSIRIESAGCRTAFIPDAFVYHKRRTSFSAFFAQIHHSGEARIMLSKLHPGSLKTVHLFPFLFTSGLVLSLLFLVLFPFLGSALVAVYLFYFLLIGLHATWTSRNILVGLMAIAASLIQLTAYGIGFFKAGIYSIMKR